VHLNGRVYDPLVGRMMSAEVNRGFLATAVTKILDVVHNPG
jgi:hypothetical protein